MRLLRKTYGGNIKRQEYQSIVNLNDIFKADIVPRSRRRCDPNSYFRKIVVVFAKVYQRDRANPFVPFARNERGWIERNKLSLVKKQ